jgi:hypothetical protein
MGMLTVPSCMWAPIPVARSIQRSLGVFQDQSFLVFPLSIVNIRIIFLNSGTSKTLNELLIQMHASCRIFVLRIAELSPSLCGCSSPYRKATSRQAKPEARVTPNTCISAT